jgi:VanZ family protein
MGGRYSRGLLRVAGSGGDDGGAEQPARGAALRAWVAVGLWIGVIFFFSGEAFSAELTRSGIGPLARLLGLDDETIVMVHFFIRKSAHVLEYAALGYLALRAAALPLGRRPGVAFALLLGLLVAGADEIHQARVTGRTGTPRDVALDFAGVGLGVALRARRRARSTGGRGRTTLSRSEGGAR